ncbi:hypothetical protein M3B90_09555 [Dermabacter sp. p3-SID358]|uniref:hypothetical protein n=1 Tax=Dermabacter sp. p3-SID358 TaxID=2916114 RepID=UPI0021A95ED8|nr:hypothetical protein [Dermabacter sp. p3-SID358]MCT1867766.1 hypothetical protein [Dermabacter sp. p3-SID358]
MLPLTALITLTACGPSVTGEDEDVTKKAEEFSLRVFARPMLDLAEGREGHTQFSTLTTSAFYDLYEKDQKLAWTWMEKAMSLQPENPAVAEAGPNEIAEALRQIGAPRWRWALGP